MTAKPRVLVTRRLPEAVEAALRGRFDITQRPGDQALSEAELHEGLRAHDAVLCTVTDRIGAERFEGGVRARLLANFGVGVNHIALDAAARAGVVVTNTPDVLTDDTADIAMLLMLGVLRRAGEGERELRSGAWRGWRPTHLLGRRLTGRTLGIVGFGRIGRAVAQRAQLGFGMRVLAWTRTVPAEGAREGVTFVGSLEELLPRVDVLSLHCPATPETRHLIGTAELARLPRGAVLVNTARGDVVDEQALVDALRSGHLGGAGLDVFEQEPDVHPGLLVRDDVMLLPHLGSATQETRVAMGMRAVANLDAFFRGAPPPDRLLLPATPL